MKVAEIKIGSVTKIAKVQEDKLGLGLWSLSERAENYLRAQTEDGKFYDSLWQETGIFGREGWTMRFYYKREEDNLFKMFGVEDEKEETPYIEIRILEVL